MSVIIYSFSVTGVLGIAYLLLSGIGMIYFAFLMEQNVDKEIYKNAGWINTRNIQKIFGYGYTEKGKKYWRLHLLCLFLFVLPGALFLFLIMVAKIVSLFNG